MDPLNELRDLPMEEAFRAARAILADQYRSSLYQLCKVGLGYQDINSRTHGRIFRSLEAPTRKKLICVPRGCFKSSIAAVGFPISCLIKNPNLRILIDSELYSNSATFLREIKSHLESPRLTDIFGEFRGDTWNEGEIVIRQRTKPSRQASITCSGIGTTKVGQHYDIIIGDDFNSEKNTGTPEGRKKVIDHIRRNISILEPNGTLVFTATRYHEEDATGFILRELVGISVEEAMARSAAA